MRGPGNKQTLTGVPRRFVINAALVAMVIGGGLGVAGVTSLANPRPVAPMPYATPEGFPKPPKAAGNTASNAKISVGRRLFYDTNLSGNQTQSCATCHQQELAFTDGQDQPVGSTGEPLPRNAPSLVNVAYNSTLTWANPALLTLEAQMAVPLFATHPVELGINDRNRDEVLRRIKRDPWYRKHFPRAFKGAENAVSWTKIIKSIASFQRSIVSANSRYDRYLRGKAELNPAEMRGMSLFMGEDAECHHCHGTFLFSDQATYRGAPAAPVLFHNNGQYNVGGTGDYPEGNQGLIEITGRKRDMGKFKAPSLRNVALTAPYMHDGSVATLEEVVANYARGGRLITEGPNAGDGRESPYLDPMIAPINLSERDQADLVAFLEALTDRSVTKEPRFSDPFEDAPRAATAKR